MTSKKTIQKHPDGRQKGNHAVSSSKKTTNMAAPIQYGHALDIIARGAYLNYRHRVENGLPGDSHTDWLEAEQQVLKK